MGTFLLNDYKKLIGQYATGVTVVTAMSEGKAVGFTCQSFHSLSLNPLLVSISIMKSSSTWPQIRARKQFAVNVLSDSQQDISAQLARSGADKWQGLDVNMTSSGSPWLSGVLFWLDCRLYAEYEVGDHLVAVGEVTETSDLDTIEPRAPLLYFSGKYCRVDDSISTGK